MTHPFPPDATWTPASTPDNAADTDRAEDAEMAAWQAAEEPAAS